MQKLRELRPHPAVRALLAVVIEKTEAQRRAEAKKKLQGIKKELQDVQSIQESALTKYLQELLPADDYFKTKNKCEQQIFKLEEELASLSMEESPVSEIDPCFDVLEQLPELYAAADAEGKKNILTTLE